MGLILKVMITTKLEDRFWSKVNKKHWKQCWPWTASTDSYGYGSFWFNGSAVMSHRIALFLKTGELPDDKVACHSCDNPLCNNPHHLWWGTHQDNMSDMVKKGRSKR